MHPVEIARLQFKAAAGEATGVELSMRMLADKVPELRAFAHSKKFEDIEDEIIKHFGDLLSDEDKKTLSASRVLRNKILHCDFEAARDKLDELGLSPKTRRCTEAQFPPQCPPRKYSEQFARLPKVMGEN